MDTSSYKAAKEAFVSDATGSSVTHINLISSVALATIALHSSLRSRTSFFSPSNNTINPLHFISDFAILVIPILLSTTLFASYPLLLTLALSIPTILITALTSPTQPTSPLLPSSPSHSNSNLNSQAEQQQYIPPLPAVTTYRAHMMLLTTICILAVDFPVFPRSLAKTESWGVSLMDLGVGSFVFSQGLVSGLPILKSPSYLTSPTLPKLTQTLRKISPLLVLGLVRVLLVKGTEYPEHVTEYGVHWNFFITLALLPPLQILLHPLIARFPPSIIALLISCVHQTILSTTPLQSLTLSPTRTTSLLSQNKEGLTSLPGYLAIHILGLSTSYLLFSPHLRNSTNERDGRIKSIIEVCSYSIVWWTFFVGGSYFSAGGGGESGVSRRLANTLYVLWTAAFNTLFILAYLLLDTFYFPPPPSPSSSLFKPSKRTKSNDGLKALQNTLPAVPKTPIGAPMLLEAINQNSLALFLFANILTGLVNLLVKTMYTPDIWALIILIGYLGVLCWSAWIWRGTKLIRL